MDRKRQIGPHLLALPPTKRHQDEHSAFNEEGPPADVTMGEASQTPVVEPWNLGAIGRYGIDTPYEPSTAPTPASTFTTDIEMEDEPNHDQPEPITAPSPKQTASKPTPYNAPLRPESSIIEANIVGSDVEPIKYLASGCNIVRDSSAPERYWKIKCMNIRHTQPQLCSYLGFHNTKELWAWEKESNIDLKMLIELRHAVQESGVAEIFKILCPLDVTASMAAVQQIETLKPWSAFLGFPGPKAKSSIQFQAIPESTIVAIFRVAAICAWIIRESPDHFPESGSLGESQFWYAPEDINRAYWYLWNRTRKLKGTYRTVRPRETITFGVVDSAGVDELRFQRAKTSEKDASISAADINFADPQSLEDRMWRSVADIRAWAHTVDPTVSDTDIDAILVDAPLIIQADDYCFLSHRLSELRMFVWKRGPLRNVDQSENKLQQRLLDLARWVQRRLFKLQWEDPSEEVERLLTSAMEAVSSNDAMSFRRNEEELEAIFPGRVRLPLRTLNEEWMTARLAKLRNWALRMLPDNRDEELKRTFDCAEDKMKNSRRRYFDGACTNIKTYVWKASILSNITRDTARSLPDLLRLQRWLYHQPLGTGDTEEIENLMDEGVKALGVNDPARFYTKKEEIEGLISNCREIVISESN